MNDENKCLNCRWIYGGELICVCPSSEFLQMDVSAEDTEGCTQFVHWDELEMISDEEKELFCEKS